MQVSSVVLFYVLFSVWPPHYIRLPCYLDIQNNGGQIESPPINRNRDKEELSNNNHLTTVLAHWYV